MSLEEVLEREGLADGSAVRAVLERAAGETRPGVALLVEEGLVAEDALADAVAREVSSVVIDMEQGALELDSVALLPEAIARGYLLVPVAPDATGQSLSVAFANPLDRAAVGLVQELTGYEVQPLVATVSGIQRAIEREYDKLRTLRPRARSEIPAEITRRVDARFPSSGSRTSTTPLHRIEHDAPLEQRFEALLLALIEAGVVTRADYIEALQRLMRRDPE